MNEIEFFQGSAELPQLCIADAEIEPCFIMEDAPVEADCMVVTIAFAHFHHALEQFGRFGNVPLFIVPARRPPRERRT